MTEAKSRRDPPIARPRARVKPELPTPGALRHEEIRFNDRIDAPPPTSEPAAPPSASAFTVTPPRPVPASEEEAGYRGFDEEINNRYEEIKRGSTHISELQQMT